MVRGDRTHVARREAARNCVDSGVRTTLEEGPTMSDLLAMAVEAHGGLARWNEFSTLRAELSIGGAIWEVKQQPGLLTNKIFEIRTHEERITITPFHRSWPAIGVHSKSPGFGNIGRRDRTNPRQPGASFCRAQQGNAMGRVSRGVLRQRGVVDISDLALPLHLPRSLSAKR
jgi:hypothetical protein